MTTIALTVEDPADLPSLVAAVRAATGRSVADVARRVRGGQPVAEFVLLGNDHAQAAARLRRLCDELPRMGGVVRAYELDDSQSLATLDDPTLAEVSLATVAGILATHDREIARQHGPPARGPWARGR